MPHAPSSSESMTSQSPSMQPRVWRLHREEQARLEQRSALRACSVCPHPRPRAARPASRAQ
eukprot:11965504-Prorocentrum_lima.AAC.1